MLSYLLLYGLPSAALIFFVVSLVLFLSARRKNKRAPGSVDPAVLRTRRLLLIIASVIAGLFAAVIIAIGLLMLMVVAYM